MTNTTIDTILYDMPGLPRDVAEHWLSPHAQRPDIGWPPPADGTTDPWASLFLARPLSWWQDRQWRREELPMVMDYMSHAVQFQVDRLVSATLEGRDLLPDSCARVTRIREGLQRTGTWDVPLVGFPDSDGLGIVDGHHRLAALHIERSNRSHTLRDLHAIWIALTRTPVVSGMG